MILLKIVCAVLIFGLIILGHEFGHFVTARMCGVTVNEFSFGMGPRIFSVQGKNTRFSLKALPLGGSCEMKGELDDTSGDPDCFINKKPWQRLIIIAAGPCFNFLMSFIVACILAAALGSDRPVVGSLMNGLPGEKAGIQCGDEVIRINNRNIKLFREISVYNSLHQGEKFEVTILRADGKHTYVIEPEFNDEYGKYMLGIMSNPEDAFPENILQLFKYGYYEVRYNFLIAIDSLSYIFNGHLTSDSVMGPVGIVGTITETVEEVAPKGARILFLTICDYILLFGTNLGIMNLLPFPALDGGRILFIIIEMILGRPVNREIEGYIHIGGFAVLILLMLYIAFNDVIRLIG